MSAVPYTSGFLFRIAVFLTDFFIFQLRWADLPDWSTMATNEDCWGYLIFVFFIVVIVIFVIKIGLEFSGLFEWNFPCSNSEDESSKSEIETDESDEAGEENEAVAQTREKLERNKNWWAGRMYMIWRQLFPCKKNRIGNYC